MPGAVSAGVRLVNHMTTREGRIEWTRFYLGPVTPPTPGPHEV